VADAPVEHGGGIVGRDEFMQFGGPAKYASGSGRRAPAARDDCAGWGRRVGGEPVEELLGDLVEGGELCLAEHVVRPAAQGVLVAQDRVAQLGRRRAQDAAGAGGRGLRAVAPEDAGQDVLGGRGVQAVDAGELSGSTAASAR
jgi:hypothetical protein